MQIVTVSLHDLQVMLDKTAQKVIEAFSDRAVQSGEKDIWFDINELCNYLPDKPAKPTVYGWVHTGLIPCHKGQKKLRFLKSEIDVWLKTGGRKTLAEIAIDTDIYLQSKKKGGSKL